MDVIEAKTAHFSLPEKNILLVVMKEDAVVDVPAAKENYEVTMQLTKGNRYAVLVDAHAYATITQEAREYTSAPEQYANVIAQAIIVSSLANRIIANFIVRFHQRNKTVEMKVFNSNETALNWLKEKIKEEEKNGIKPKKSKKLQMFASI